MKKIISWLLVLMASNVFSETAGESLQTKLNAIRSMSANFTQIVKAKKRQLSQSSGKMALTRPGRFRWQTQAPMEQLVVADGEKLWVYDVDLEQVTVKNQEQGLGGTAALFLSGNNERLTQDFEVTLLNEGSRQRYNLQAKSSKANFQQVQLEFIKEILSSMEMDDQLGQHTIVRLKNIKINPKLALSLFQFTPPKGIDLIKQ